MIRRIDVLKGCETRPGMTKDLVGAGRAIILSAAPDLLPA
jgi:hypothetical protein